MPKHEPAEYLPTDGRSPLGNVIYRCPACGLGFPGAPAAGVACTGRKGKQAIETDCVHRGAKAIETVPCVTCAKSGATVQIKVFPCGFEPGRKCSMVDVGRGDIKFCGGCGDRTRTG